MTNADIRTVYIDDTEINYQLERKPVRNLNLRIRKDGSIYVSANELVTTKKVDEFVLSKGTYIISSLKHFEELAQYQPQPKQYVSGETFYIQGRGLRLKVSEGTKDSIEADGVYIYLQVKCPDDTLKKQRSLTTMGFVYISRVIDLGGVNLGSSKGAYKSVVHPPIICNIRYIFK